jgi:hypothetical protein
VVLSGILPEKLQKAAEMYAGCVSGAMQKEEYLNLIKELGVANVEVKKEKVIEIPDSILLNYINNDELSAFKKEKTGIYSITVTADKK